MENWIQNVLSKWQSEGVKLNPPASGAEIENVETILNFKFPQDFKEFYLQANGFADLDWQEHMFTFWPLDMIVEEFESHYSDKDFIGFSDFLLASHMIGFSRKKPGIFKSYDSLDGEPIAERFDVIIEMINSNNDRIY
ncbi:SMI1/KNR4 family protein [Mucilaginibacter mali]|uniref:SMI1/KNR4 family protein n=1 Tax=Mucilaginibacter mali TaxID=2740462 RepID=A0A7D4PT13_9SPHI|nr:SMI1/KNR4 family protein [Mucilaginibacter mali]QKJ29303.1 SMI1/KNR4 family protein [Mucilaginibacter mali]